MTAIFAHRGTTTSQVGGPSAGTRTCPGDALESVPGEAARPGASGARENTLEAFGAARRAGADGVELDVRLCADHVPVIHHDRRLPDGREIANVPRESLPPGVPSLLAALRACRGLSVNVEVKAEHGERSTAEVVAAVVATVLAEAELVGGVAAESSVNPAPPVAKPAPPAPPLAPPAPPLAKPALPPVLVSSFDLESLAAVRTLQPSVPLGLLIDWRTDPETGLRQAAELGCATLHPFVTQVDAALVAAASRMAIGLHVWTVNAEADLKKMGDLHVAAVITDRVPVARRILHPSASNGDAVTG